MTSNRNYTSTHGGALKPGYRGPGARSLSELKQELRADPAARLSVLYGAPQARMMHSLLTTLQGLSGAAPERPGHWSSAGGPETELLWHPDTGAEWEREERLLAPPGPLLAANTLSQDLGIYAPAVKALLKEPTRKGASPKGVSPKGASPKGVSPKGASPKGVSPKGASPKGARQPTADGFKADVLRVGQPIKSPAAKANSEKARQNAEALLGPYAERVQRASAPASSSPYKKAVKDLFRQQSAGSGNQKRTQGKNKQEFGSESVRAQAPKPAVPLIADPATLNAWDPIQRRAVHNPGILDHAFGMVEGVLGGRQWMRQKQRTGFHQFVRLHPELRPPRLDDDPGKRGQQETEIKQALLHFDRWFSPLRSTFDDAMTMRQWERMAEDVDNVGWGGALERQLRNVFVGSHHTETPEQQRRRAQVVEGARRKMRFEDFQQYLRRQGIGLTRLQEQALRNQLAWETWKLEDDRKIYEQTFRDVLTLAAIDRGAGRLRNAAMIANVGRTPVGRLGIAAAFGGGENGLQQVLTRTQVDPGAGLRDLVQEGGRGFRDGVIGGTGLGVLGEVLGWVLRRSRGSTAADVPSATSGVRHATDLDAGLEQAQDLAKVTTVVPPAKPTIPAVAKSEASSSLPASQQSYQVEVGNSSSKVLPAAKRLDRLVWEIIQGKGGRATPEAVIVGGSKQGWTTAEVEQAVRVLLEKGVLRREADGKLRVLQREPPPIKPFRSGEYHSLDVPYGVLGIERELRRRFQEVGPEWVDLPGQIEAAKANRIKAYELKNPTEGAYWGTEELRLQGKLERLREYLRQPVHVESPTTISPDFDTKRPLPASVIQDIEQALPAILRLVNAPDIEGKSLRFFEIPKGSTARSFFEGWDAEGNLLPIPEIHLRTDAERPIAETLAHELGHWVEASNPTLLDEAQDYLRMRTTLNDKPLPPEPLNHYFDALDHEWMRQGFFLSPYVGKMPYQRGGRVVGTELISSALEWAYKNPAAFAQYDPEFFLWWLLNGRER